MPVLWSYSATGLGLCVAYRIGGVSRECAVNASPFDRMRDLLRFPEEACGYLEGLQLVSPTSDVILGRAGVKIFDGKHLLNLVGLTV